MKTYERPVTVTMTYYKARMEYIGTDFCGWQTQSYDPSIQNTLNQCLIKLCGGNAEGIKTLASSRTDAGVHALDQVVRIILPKKFTAEKLKISLNSILPPSIKIKELYESDESFHPLRFIEKKEYFYLFQEENSATVFTRPYVHTFRGKLNLDAMKSAAKIFLGAHDFLYYQSTGTEVKSTVRTIFESDVTQTHCNPFLGWQHAEGLYLFSVQGNGFLRQMVRSMAGIILGSGKGEITPEQIDKTLQGKQIKKLTSVLPANALFLKDSWPKF